MRRRQGPVGSQSDPDAELEQALKSSSLFYKSHLAAWIAGRVPLEDIRREPQDKLPATRQRAND